MMMDAGEIERVPIYLDSPLAVNATRVFRRSAALFDEEAHDFMRRGRHESVFDFPEVHYVGSVEESKALNETEGPMVIISASGMAEAGRVLHHLKNNIGDPHNVVLIVGWQAPHTLGRRLVERRRTVKIFGDEYRLRARVETINGFSAHADRDGLLRWVDRIASEFEGVYLVHGDPEAAFALREGLEAQGIRHVHVPELDETVNV
jgi:metallo-beta-lactamase family protein